MTHNAQYSLIHDSANSIKGRNQCLLKKKNISLYGLCDAEDSAISVNFTFWRFLLTVGPKLVVEGPPGL